MPELKDQIRTYFESIAPPVQARPEPRRSWLRLRPLMAWTVGVAVVAVPTLVLWMLFGRGVEPEPTIPPATTVTTAVETTLPPDTTVTTVPQTTTSQGTPTTAVPAETETIGTWIPIPDAPVAMDPSVSAWTGSELIVWGDDSGAEASKVGLVFNPETQEWRETASAPDFRDSPVAVWSGNQLLVWGGWDGNGLTNDGFAYDPISDLWTEVPPAPLSPRYYSFRVWTGQELIIWGGMEELNETLQIGATDGAAYNPETGRWRNLADSPLGRRNPGVAVWTGEVMIIGGNGDHTDGDDSWAAYNPETDSWTDLPYPPLRYASVYDGVWTGTEVIMSMVDFSDEPTSLLFALNPETGLWRTAAAPDAILEGLGHAWTGTYLVYWGRDWLGDLVALAYGPEADQWTQLASSPLSSRQSYRSLTSAGGPVISWGGIGGSPTMRPLADGAILILDEPASSKSVSAVNLISSLFPLVGDLSRAADLPWDPAGVALGLGDSIVRTVEPTDLTDPSTWELDVSGYNGATGPFSVLDAIARLAPIDDILVQEGPHDHCASPPKPAPSGFELFRRVSVQPSSFDSCLQWWTIDLFVTTQGNIRAITYDFWEP